MKLLQIALTSAAPVLSLACFTLVGAVLARRGMLPRDGRVVLGNLCKSLLLPCLIYTKLGSTLHLENVATLWTIPALAVFNVGCGLIIGLLCSKCAPASNQRENRLRTAFLAVGNLGNMPLVFVSALCDDSTSLVAGIQDCKDTGQGYVMLGMWVGTVTQWTVGEMLLKPRPEKADNFQAIESTEIPPDEGETVELGAEINPETPRQQSKTDFLAETPTGGTSREVVEAGPASLWSGFVKVVSQPPLVAVLLAVLTASVPPFQAWLFDLESPLRIVVNCLRGFADGFIPLILLLLGANLSQGPGRPTGSDAFKTLLIPIAARLVLLPILGSACVVALWAFGAIPADPLLLFVLLLLNTTPTAINLNTIATIHGFQQDLVAAGLFYQYVSALGMMCFWLFLYFNILEWIL